MNKITMIILLLLLAGFAFIWKVMDGLPQTENLHELELVSASQVFDKDGVLISKLFEQNRIVVSGSQMSPYLKKAVIANEDARFYHHLGVDPVGIARALVVNFTSGEIAEGGSTITQQLAREMFLNQERTLVRKIREAILAVKLNFRFSKEEILEAYLNQIYLGEGAYGVEAASQAYFGKSAADLTLSESAMIAGLARGPSLFSPYNSVERATDRRNIVLEGMFAKGYISEMEKTLAQNEPLTVKARKERSVKASFFIDYVADELVKRYGEEAVYKQGLKIYTTLDLKLQELAENTLGEYQGAVLALDPINGEIRAMVGGNDYAASQRNRVIDEIRQPGSAFKPFVYAVAINQGMAANSLMVDEKISISGYEPQNYNHKYLGAMTLKKALRWSVNTVAVKLGRQVGMDQVVQLAKELGITSIGDDDNHLASALGGLSQGVNLLELTAAYSAFANEGVYSKPFAILRVENERGQVLDSFLPQQKVVLTKETAYIMTDLMMGSIYNGTASGANIGREAAGKTGTTDQYETAWFIGYTPDLLLGIYVGNDDRTPGDLSGTQVANMWGRYMNKALDGVKKRDFPVPDTIIKSVPVCANTGQRPESNCKDVEYSAFIKGTEPKTLMQKVKEKILPPEEKKQEKKSSWWRIIPGLPKF